MDDAIVFFSFVVSFIFIGFVFAAFDKLIEEDK